MDVDTSDLFECRAPQLYEELPQRALVAEDEVLDEFFDVLQTPEKTGVVSPDEFFTPLVSQATLKTGNQSRRNSQVDAVVLSPIVEEESETPSAVAKEVEKRVIAKALRRSNRPSTSYARDDADRSARQIFEGITLGPAPSPKTHPMVTRLDVLRNTPKMKLRNREVLKRKHTDGSAPPSKYVCLAEEVHYFFKNTPPRFKRSSSNQPNQGLPKKSLFGKLKLTVPVSPHLNTKERHRSPVQQAPVEERFKPEVHPFNPNVFNTPDASARPPPKPFTIPQPFSFKEVPKKECQPSQEEVFVFKARPVPPSCRNSVRSSSSVSASNMQAMDTLSGTVETLSSIDEEVPREETHKGVYHTRGNGKFIVKPFRFNMRDNTQNSKDQQSHTTRFVARPVPPSCYNPRLSTSSRSSVSSKRSSMVTVEKRVRYPSMAPAAGTKKHSCNGLSTDFKFKANPPTVLRKSPFKVKSSDKPLTEISDFVLNTERRAKERELYEKRIEEQRKAEEIARKEAAANRAELEKEELIRLRKSLVPKPHPLPAYIRAKVSTPKK